jgi:histidinol-phosphate/aromatic aminotransferase/cobyric acid decarboxylase-like protein
MRPDWKVPPLNGAKYNLSNNVCIDPAIELPINTRELTQYPNYYPAYNAVADYYNVKIDHLMVGFGIGELFTRMLQHGNLGNISIVEPAWPMPGIHLDVSTTPYISFTFDNLKTGLTDTLYLSNPNSLDGTVLTREQIIKLLPFYKYVICDEAYMDFSSHTMIDSYEKYPNLIILKTFSKSIAMPGLRFGFCISSNKEFVDRLQSTRPNAVMTGIAAALVPELIQMIPEHVSRMKITKNKIESTYECIPSEGNYVLLKGNSMINYDNTQVKEVSQGVYRMALFNIDLYNEIFNG